MAVYLPTVGLNSQYAVPYASQLGAQTVIPNTAVVPGIANSGIVAQPGYGTQPLVGGMTTNNQLYQGSYDYNQGLFGQCPWWIWLVLAFLLLVGLVAGLISAFSINSNVDEKQQRRRRNTSENGPDQDSRETSSNTKTTTKTTVSNSDQNEQAGASSNNGEPSQHHLRYSMWV